MHDSALELCTVLNCIGYNIAYYAEQRISTYLISHTIRLVQIAPGLAALQTFVNSTRS